MNYAIIYNDGNLSLQDFKLECQKEGWIPILVLREQNKSITVPLFTDFDIAHNFMRRNIDKTVISGLINLIDQDINKIKEKGWEIKFMNWPSKFTNSPTYEISFEIMELEMEYRTYRQIKD